MPSKRSGAVACVLVVVLAIPSLGVDDPLVQRVERAILAAEPGWTCIHGVLNAPPPEVASEKLLVTSVWEHDNPQQKVWMMISRVKSRNDASLSLGPVREGKISEGWTVEPHHIGDEGFVMAYTNGSLYEITFRKGTIIVTVKGASIAITNKFAKYAEAEIATK